MRDAVDFMSAPDPQLLHDLELDALCYTGSARPSQDWVDRCRALGVIVTFVQETVSTRSQQGYQAGVYDCQFAESRAKELGHTGSIAYVVSDGSWSDVWDASDYGRGVQSVATLPFFAYGAVPICESFNEGAPHSLGTWVPETWGTGTLLTQVVGASPVADTDLNHVHADYTGSAQVPLPKDDDDMWIAVAPSTAFSVFGFLKGREFTGARAFAGIPDDAIEYANSMQPHIPIRFISDAEAQGIIGASQLALTASTGSGAPGQYKGTVELSAV